MKDQKKLKNNDSNKNMNYNSKHVERKKDQKKELITKDDSVIQMD